jgi:hypothetical protein
LFWALAGAHAETAPDKLSVIEKRDYCLRWITPEKMVLHQYGPASRQGLYDYATCMEVVSKDDDLCDYFPGGPKPRGKLSKEGAPEKKYTYVKSDGKIHFTYEYGVCTSRAAGYLLLKALVEDRPLEELVPYARRMLYGEKGISPEDFAEAARAIYKSGRQEWPKHPEIAKRGYFNYLLGDEACGLVALKKLQGECRMKAAALAALKAGDPARCQKYDLMCEALFKGEKSCEEPGRAAVKSFCDDVFPTLTLKADEWKMLRAPLEPLNGTRPN